MRRITVTVLVVLLVVLAGCASGGGDGSNALGAPNQQVANGGGSGSVGVSVGGAQDANVFRRNVEEGYVPQPTDIVPEGVYHDYYFDTNLSAPCDARFCAAYDRAVSEDPISGDREQYLAVGLNSGITQAELQREQLNLIVVLDTSGSMSERFDRYAYDRNGNGTVDGNDADAADARPTTKMSAAANAVDTLTRKLGDDDRLAVVTYSNGARVRQPMERVGDLDPAALRDRIHGIAADGGTNLAAGMAEASDIADRYPGEGDNRTTRIVYVTDAMPNIGDTSTGGLGGQIQSQAERGIHTTFVGVGVDFNSRLTNALSDVRGANYYSVDSASAFEERMDEGFTYMVTPIAHDLSLSVAGEGYQIEHVYGAPGAADGGESDEDGARQLLDVSTLFPSRSENGSGEGSVMLVELDRDGKESDGQVTLTASYETPDGETHERTKTVAFADREAPYYESAGVRKAVALTRYSNLMTNWAAHERAMKNGEEMEVSAGVERRDDLGQWEQTSVELGVTEPYDERIATFRTYFENEMDALNASRMEQDLAILRTLDQQHG